VLTCALIDNRVESFLSYLIRPDDPTLTGTTAERREGKDCSIEKGREG
jgi:hypothetical protein